MLLSKDLRAKKIYIDDNMLPISLSFQNNIQLSNQMEFDNLYNVFNELDDKGEYMVNYACPTGKGVVRE